MSKYPCPTAQPWTKHPCVKPVAVKDPAPKIVDIALYLLQFSLVEEWMQYV